MVRRIEVRLITSGPSDRKLVSQPRQVVPRPTWTCCDNSHTDCTCTALAQHIIENEPRLGSPKIMKKKKKKHCINVIQMLHADCFTSVVPSSMVAVRVPVNLGGESFTSNTTTLARPLRSLDSRPSCNQQNTTQSQGSGHFFILLDTTGPSGIRTRYLQFTSSCADSHPNQQPK